MSRRLQKISDSKLLNPFKENYYSFFSSFITGFILLFIYFMFRMIPFGDITILRMDLYHQYGPLFAEFFERITNEHSLIYSWTSGLGSSFLGNFYNYISSPFAIIMLIFGHENMPEAIATMILLKASLASGLFTYYLKKSLNKHNFTTAAFGILYAFCGYFIAYYWNVMWLDAMAFFPLVILGIERIINLRKPSLYLIMLSLTMLANYYIAYMVCMLSVLYFLYYYFSKYSLAEPVRQGLAPVLNKNGKIKKIGLKVFYRKAINSKFITSGVVFAFASLSALILLSFALMPISFVLQNSSATSASFPSSYTSYYSIFDFLANHLSGVEPTIRSSGSDVLPNVYSGMITIILLPLYLYSKSFSFREKISSITLLSVFYLSFNMNYINFIWHGFHFPNDLPYRFSFAYSFLILVLAYKAFTKLKEFTKQQIMSAGIATIAFVIIVQKIGSKNVDDVVVWTSIALVVVYVCVLILMKNPKYHVGAMSVLLLCAISTDTIISNSSNFTMSQPKTNYVGDYQEFKEMKDYVDALENNQFYRMELTNLRTRMDNSWYFYNGASIFSSMAYEHVSKLQKQLGMFGNNINSFTYNLQTPIYNSMFALDYIFDNSSLSMNPNLFRPLDSNSKFKVYENLYSLPLAYCVDASLADNWNIHSSNPFEVQSDYFRHATGVSNVFNQLGLNVGEYNNINTINESSLDSGSITFFRSVNDKDASVTFTVTCERTENIYIYFSSRSVEKITVNSSKFNKIQSVDRPYVLDLGMHDEGDEIIIDVGINSGNSGNMNLYVAGLDKDNFVEGYNKILSNGIFRIEDFEDTKIIGDISAASDMLLYTSIPYDEGWTVTIDGQKVNKDEYVKIGDGLLGVSISEGIHRLEFNYSPRGLLEGIVISVLYGVFLIFMLFLKKFNLLIFSKKNTKKFMLDPKIDYIANTSVLTENFDNKIIEVDSDGSVSENPKNDDYYDISDSDNDKSQSDND